MSGMTAKEILIHEGWLPGSGAINTPQEILETLNSKYPDQKAEIVAAMVTSLLDNPGSGIEAAKANRIDMIDATAKTCSILEAHSEAFKRAGKSPIINDTSKYEGTTFEENAAMVKEDIELGLRLYNACAQFVRDYNTAKKES